MTDHDPAPTTPISHGGSRTYRAEDDLSGGGSRMITRLLTPFLAVIPWLLVMGGLWLLARAGRTLSERLETQWGPVLGAVAVLVVAALLWAVVTAWSSAGTTLAGLLTLAAGVALSDLDIARRVHEALPHAVVDDSWRVVTPVNFFLVGSLLLAAGLGASGARRMRR